MAASLVSCVVIQETLSVGFWKDLIHWVGRLAASLLISGEDGLVDE